MNCNCCNSNQSRRCGEGDGEIKIYGQLVNSTLDVTLDDANCQADNKSYDTGHNDALAYAYQLHDGRFRADDKDLPAHERFQDAINRRITNITFAPDSNTTNIEGNVTVNGEPIQYDDQWLKDIIGSNPDNTRADELKNADVDGDGTKDNIGNIIDFILALSAEINDLRKRVADLELKGGGEDTDTCYWEVTDDGYLYPNDEKINAKCKRNCAGVRGPGFYDTLVS